MSKCISKHLNNIFRCGELKEDSVYSILEYTANIGKKWCAITLLNDLTAMDILGKL